MASGAAPIPCARAWLELAGFLAMGVVAVQGVLGPFPLIPVWLYAALLLRRRGGWRSVGFSRPADWPRLLGIGGVTGLALVVGPLDSVLIRCFGHADLSAFEDIRGSLPVLCLYVALGIVYAGLGEEMVFRAYLLPVLESAFAPFRLSDCWLTVLAVATNAMLFAVPHLYQGLSGVVGAAVAGIVLATLYLRSGRNLWAPVTAHATVDVLSFVLIYFGHYPIRWF